MKHCPQCGRDVPLARLDMWAGVCYGCRNARQEMARYWRRLGSPLAVHKGRIAYMPLANLEDAA